MKPNAIQYLSLARKAGRIEVGEEPTGACARAGHARLVIVASDAPENTVRRGRSFVAGTEQQLAIVPFTKDEMGAALGRSSVALAALTDPALALALLQALEDPKRYGKAIEDLTDRSNRMKQHRREELAHERNLRTGRKRTEAPEKAEREEKPQQPAQKPCRPAAKPDRTAQKPRSASGPAYRSGEKPQRPADKPKTAAGRSHGPAAKPWERTGHPENTKKPIGGKTAVPLRKSPARGPKQQGSNVNRPAGYKTGRKTHGGAE